jgi:hypothetical protein
VFKKRFKQYTTLKHKKRVQSCDLAFTKQVGENLFFIPNRITKALFKQFPLSLSGCNHYTGYIYGSPAPSFIKYKNIIFPGIWVNSLVKLKEKPLSLPFILMYTSLVRVLFVLQARLTTLLHANLL